MAVRASLSRFPVDRDAHESSGLPWGLTVTPFSPADEHGVAPLFGAEGHSLPRCENCWAYFNTYCELDQWSWNCALCGALNGLSSRDVDRYSESGSHPEMVSSFVDLEISVEGTGEETIEARPVYVAAVDLSCFQGNGNSSASAPGSHPREEDS